MSGLTLGCFSLSFGTDAGGSRNAECGLRKAEGGRRKAEGGN